MTFIVSYVLILLAAFFNACMDAFENTANFNESIFKNLDKRFWCKDVSWNYAKKLFGYKFDSWHLAKSAMIFCLIGAVIVYRPHHQWWVHFISMGLIWNATFFLFYHKIFRVK
jgi:hypothetical protein